MNNLSIIEINLQLQAVTPQTLETISACTEYGSKLAGWIAYTGLAKAQAKRDLLQKKKETIDKLMNEGHRLTPANFKEYVTASVSKRNIFMNWQTVPMQPPPIN